MKKNRKKSHNSPNGWVLFNKPYDMGSTDCVSFAKRVIREAYPDIKPKVGHAGTLDPLATGVLILALGDATKLVDYVMHEEKTYVFRAIWGEARDTDDAEGQTIATSDKVPTREEIEAILPEFTGTIEQVPPKFSAVKIKGERAYDLARSGKEFKIEPKEVEIHHLSIISHGNYEEPEHIPPAYGGEGAHSAEGGVVATTVGSKEPPPNPPRKRGGDDSVPPQAAGDVIVPPQAGAIRTVHYTDFVCECGKGTYVRSLARDIAEKLNTCAYIGMLERSRLGKCSIDDTISLDLFEEMVHKGDPITGVLTCEDDSWLIPMEWMLDDIPAWSVPEGIAKRIKHGNSVNLIPGRYPDFMDELGEGEILQVSCNGKLLALCTVEAQKEYGELKPTRVFNW